MKRKKIKKTGMDYMAEEKVQTIQGEVETPVEPDPKAYAYSCPKCSQVAIKTSNHMLGVMIDCMACKQLIKLDNEANYTKL